MATLKTPTLNTKGLYSLKAPFTVVDKVAYTCAAVRSFKELVASGTDVFALYYQPNGLDQATCEADLAAGASLVTLLADGYPTVNVPDTYLTAFPQVGNVIYSTPIVGINLGPLPDGLDLTFLLQQLTNAAQAVIGVAPQIEVFVSPSATVLTQAEADDAEAARQAAITNTTSDYTALQAKSAQYDALLTQYQELEAYVISLQPASP